MPEHLYKRGDIWWGRIQVNGRDHRRSLRTRNRAEANRRLEAFRDELTASVFYGEERLVWWQAVTRYAGQVMPSTVKGSTQKRYNTSFRMVDPHLHDIFVDRITVKTLDKLVRARRKDGATNATINRDLTAISSVLRAAKTWGACQHNVADDYERSILTREQREPITPPTADDVEIVCKRAPGMFADLIRFLDLEGMRQEEAASLEWPQINLRSGQVTLTRTKTSRPRTLTLSDASVALLSNLPRSLVGKYVFWHGSGERYANVASRFRIMIVSAQKTARLNSGSFTPFRCHDLRHGYAIRELQGGRDIYDLSRHLGHSSVKVTERYLGYVAGGAPISRRHENRHSGDGLPAETDKKLVS